mgnify:FL=1
MAFSLVFYCSLFKLYIITHIIFVNLFNNFHTFIIKFVYYKGKYVKTNNYDITFKAITQLYNRGYEEFIFISEDLDTSITRIERKNGFIDAIQ